ncbi:MAG TPA: patatin-like phospholipase family protein [Polyangia bacterium]|nr:patatin-like phospholipase family protein [Polyangia bacterium]
MSHRVRLLVILACSSIAVAPAPPARASKERPAPQPATGQGPDADLQELGGEAAPARTPEEMAASWQHWAPLFAPRLQRVRPAGHPKAGNDMPTMQAARGQGQRLSAQQAALLDKLRSMLTPYKALVVSGGVSLGSYQAGFLYYTTLILRRFDAELRRLGWNGPDVGRFRVVTGASAGSINGFLSSISGCRALGDDPEQSPFFKAWIGVGLRELRERPSTFDALFDHAALDRPVQDTLALLKSESGWRGPPCDGIFGVTATRLEARPIDINDPDDEKNGATPDVTLSRQTEKFLLGYDFEGSPKKPRFTSYRLAWEDGSPLVASVYPTLGLKPPGKPEDAVVDVDDIATLLRASAAFPLAFQPVAVPLTIWEPGPGDKLIPHVQMPRFLDGGLLDNTPLRLAQKLLQSEGCSKTDGADIDPRGATILFSKSGTEGWRRPQPPLTLAETKRLNEAIQAGTLPRSDQTVLGELGGFFGQFINNTTDMEALEALELMAADEAFDRPGDDGSSASAPSAAAPGAPQRACRTRRRIVSPEVPARGMPVAGQFLAHFGAFLERDFRIFDFYQGVVDAQEHAEKHLLLNPALVTVASPIFVCFRDYRKLTAAAAPEADPPALPASCVGVAPNLRALLRASARVRQSAWRAPADDEFAVFLAALHDEQFHYQTLAHDEVMDPDQVQFVLREELHGSLHELGRAQGGLLSPNVLAVSVGAKAGADLYRHRSPNFVAVGVSNGLELSAGLLGDPMRSATGRLAWKLAPSLRWANPDHFSPVDDMSRLSSSSPLRTIDLDTALEARLEIDLRPLGPLQLEIGLGYEVRQRVEAAAWVVPKPWQPVSRRHGPVGSLSLILLQRLYLTASLSHWLQRPCTVADVNVGCPGVESAYWGYEPIETNSWPLRLSGGWRALW